MLKAKKKPASQLIINVDVMALVLRRARKKK